jgi:sulfur-oxidizing protein SoxY
MPTRPTAITRRHALAAAAGLLVAAGAQAQLKSGDNPDASPRWQQVRASLFKGRAIDAHGEGVVTLDAPARAEDAAVVPIAIRARFDQKPERHIKQVWLIIDNNPSPVSAIFNYTLDSGRADIETRVRIDEYTFVRAIAETNDGKLHMVTRFVKAAGGCSAPPGKDAAAALATLGQMRLRVASDAATSR